MKKKFILMFILIFIIIGGLFLTFILTRNTESENLDSQKSGNKSDIIQSYIDDDAIVMLTSEGDLYVIGKNPDNCWGDIGNVVKKPTLVAKNVKVFFSGGSAYIDNDDNLYVAGLKPTGGVYDKYEKIGSNIKTISSYMLGLLAVSNDGYLYSVGHKTYNGIGVKYTELTKVEGFSNVKDVRISLTYSLYLTENGELYLRNPVDSKPKEYTKVLDNVEKIKSGYAITNDGKVYRILGCHGYEKPSTDSIKLIGEEKNMQILSTSNFKVNGKICASINTDESGKITYEPLNSIKYEKFPNDDIKDLMYMSVSKGNVIYLNNNNNIVIDVIGDENEKTEIKYSLDNMKKIYDNLKIFNTQNY